ncbi:MAG: tetratricopeptide repeat protein [Ruminococcaceae bacterium]|nr:tetratricopeptide repeat protein [Oscillospiraceae bacterium]
MASQVTDLQCPGCGSRVSIDQETCDFCHSPVTISTFNSVSSMSPLQVNKYAASYREALKEDPDNRAINTSIAMCYLKLRMYDEAYAAFSKAIVDNFDNSETYFYAAICLLKGRKAFLLSRPEIDKILELMNAATMIEDRGIYFYFLAYIKYDYFKRKFLNTTPNYKDYLAQAKLRGYSSLDVDTMFSIMGVDKISIV